MILTFLVLAGDQGEITASCLPEITAMYLPEIRLSWDGEHS
jgi:hypothetical protein